MTNTYVLSALVVFLAGWVIATEVSKRWKAYQKRKSELGDRVKENANRLIAAMESLTSSLEKTAANDADATKLLAGTLKACEAIAASTVELREEIGKFAKLVGGDAKDKSYPEDNITQPPTDAESEKAGVYIEALLRNIPVKQAQQEADEYEEKKMAYSAVSMGPEE